MKRRLKWAIAGILLLVGLFYGIGGWHFSNVLNERALDAESMRAAYPPAYDLRVTHVTDKTVDLRATDGDPSDLERLSIDRVFYSGLIWDGGSIMRGLPSLGPLAGAIPIRGIPRPEEVAGGARRR